MTITVRPALAEEIARRWPEIEPLLKTATERFDHRYKPIHIMAQALSGQVLIWLVLDGDALLAVAVTELHNYAVTRALEIPWLAGDRIEEWWEIFHEAMRAHQQKHGCDVIVTVCGRPGFLRFWQSRGIKVKNLGTVIALD